MKIMDRKLRPKRGLTPLFYLGICGLMTAGIVIGFWPTYFAPLSAGTLDIRPVVEIHAVIFMGWMLLLIVQASLAYVRRVDLHQKVGIVGAGYGALIIVVGVLVVLDSFSADIATGDIRRAHSNLLIPLVDLVLFATFFGAAIIYRKRPDIHKRLIILASIVMFGPAVGRMTFLTSVPQMAAVTFGPILLCMAYDVMTRGRPHRVYIIGLVAFVVSVFRMPLRESDAWINFTMWISGL